MCREMLCCTLVCVLVLDLVSSAPIASSSADAPPGGKLSLYFNDVAGLNDELADAPHDQSSRHNEDDDDDDDDVSKLMGEDDDILSDLLAEIDAPRQRSRRHAVQSDDFIADAADDEDIDAALSVDHLSKATRRHRRSAVFMLHAALKLCQLDLLGSERIQRMNQNRNRRHRRICRGFEITERNSDIKLSIQLVDE